MFKTKITKMLGIERPLIGGTMMSITTPDFAAAISNAGGLGVIASAIYKTADAFEAALDRAMALTHRPFAVNINLFPGLVPVDNAVYSEILIRKGVKIVESSGHAAPEDLCREWKAAGLTWIHKCVGVKHALKAQALGADIVTVVGHENGGATGRWDIGTLPLIPAVVDALDIPVIGGGGVSDARGLLSVLCLGAQGVIMGTRLLMTKEAPVHHRLKKALVAASETDTLLVMRSLGATHRVWNNACARRIVEMESVEADINEIFSAAGGAKVRKMYQDGDLDVGMISCGQGVGLSRDIPSVKALFDQMISEAADIHHRIAPV